MHTFDDFELGEELPLGDAVFDLDEMIAFARRWDPQPFHVDPEAAARTAYGEVIASGWQTLAAVGGTGMDDVRLRAPVRGGDVLTAKATVAAKEPSRSGHPRGRIDFRVDFVNQHGELAGEYIVSLLLARPAAAG